LVDLLEEGECEVVGWGVEEEMGITDEDQPFFEQYILRRLEDS